MVLVPLLCVTWSTLGVSGRVVSHFSSCCCSFTASFCLIQSSWLSPMSGQGPFGDVLNRMYMYLWSPMSRIIWSFHSAYSQFSAKLHVKCCDVLFYWLAFHLITAVESGPFENHISPNVEESFQFHNHVFVLLRSSAVTCVDASTPLLPPLGNKAAY